MSREDLSAMLTEMADEVRPRPLAEHVWAKARQVRRRRAVVGAAVAVLVISTAITLTQRPAHSPPPTDTPSSSSTTAKARIDQLPSTIPTAADAAPYWPPSLNPPANAPTYRAAPLSHAVLLFQPNSEGPIYAYGEGSSNGGSGNGSFQWVRLDVSLTDTRDAGGNLAVPLDLGSLGPHGVSAAFAQPNEFVIADLREGTVQRIPLPGLNEEVTWLPDGRHLFVSGDTKTWLVATDHVIGQVAVPGYEVASLVGEARGLTTTSIASTDQPMTVRRFDDEGRAEIGRFEVDVTGAAPYRPYFLAPRGWRMGNLTAQAASGQVGNHPGDFVVVVDDRTEAVTHVLDLGTGRNKLCCAVMGWENAETVLVRTEQDGLLRWHLPTGAVTRLVASAPGSMSVAPNGCDWSVTIENSTSACTT